MFASVKRAVRSIRASIFRAQSKRDSELAYWKVRHAEQGGALSHAHYEPLYTDVFGLSRDNYAGKRVLDIGCGPRGSLEWADMTARRVGLDPLAADYLKLGADKHAMEYVASGSEEIPFPDGYFDIVTCLNALDHVDDIEATVREIKRVTKQGGMFLLSVETDHPPTPTEPISVTDATLESFAPELRVVSAFRVGTPANHDLHGAVISRSPIYRAGQPGIYVARYRRA